MHIAVVSLFPEMFSALTDYGVVGRAVTQQQLKLSCHNPRQFAQGNYQRIDDRPYGGGPGMIMQAEPLMKSLAQAKQTIRSDVAPKNQLNAEHSDIFNGAIKTVYLSPQGKRFEQSQAQRWANKASEQALILIAGRYEGVDERFIQSCVDEELSIGDYVISGGELAAMVVIDAVTRLLPEVLGHPQSAQQDSFSDGLLDCPHYTRPEALNDSSVPEVLLSGNHRAIRRWRLQQALGRTWLRRPELLENRDMSDEEKKLLAAFKNDWQHTQN